MADTAQLVLVELGRMARVLEDRIESPDAFMSWMVELGWDVPAVSASSLSNLASQLSNLISLLEQVESGDFSEIDDAVLQQIATEALALIAAAKDLPALFSGISLPAEFLQKAPEQIALSIFLGYLENNHPLVYAAFRAVGVITVIPKPAEGNRPSYEAQEFSLEALGEFFNDPGNIYRWGKSDADLAGLRDNLQLLANAFGIPAYRQSPSADQTEELYAAVPAELEESTWELRIPLLEVADEELGYGTAGFAVLPLFDSELATDGLAIVPFAEGELGLEIPLGEKFVLRLGGGLAGSIRIEVRYGGSRIVVREDGSNFRASGAVEVALKESGEPTIVFGERDTSRLEIGGLSAGLEATATGANVDAAITFTLQDGKLFVAVSKGDGFLQKIFGDLTLESKLELGIGWSTLDGFFFSGSAGFEVTIPIHVSLGPIKLESILVGMLFNMEDAELEARLGLTAGLELGPIAASINRVGILAKLSQKENGNLGPLNIGPPEFLPPTGAGLAIDAGTIAGGGYLEFDDPNKRYAGILQLQAGGIGLVAIGLITTRMPDGSDGFSLLINIGVEFMPPIQLPYGFTLSGIGGLLGYNRTMMTDVLRDGLRNRTLDSILFPEDPIANAPKIISDLRAVFPPVEDRFVIGPMVKLGWGTPVNIIQADIGIFIELPMPIRIALLGQIAATLPTPDQTIIELHIDVLGVIEFDKQLLSIDATIYDSRIYEYTLTGDAALRLSWGDAPVFATSLGGFHPRFSPPPNFPSLRRLTLNLSQGSAVQLYCKTYQALTSNSLQFGALVDLYATQSSATVEGNLTFDALIYFSPFSFVAAMSANVVARYKGHKLSSVYLSLNLSGPTPWNARGKASFEILFWDVEVEFNKTWGPTKAITLEAVDPWPPLKDALEANESWGSKLPDRNGMVEILAEIEEEEEMSPPLVLHPAGFLEIRQNVLPLGIHLDKLGNAPVKDHHQFNIDSITVGSETLILTDVDEDFARGQFIKLSDSEKLSRPSFEKMKAGVAASSDRLSFEKNEYTALTYESILIQEDRTSKEANHKDKATLDWRVAKRQLFGNAARRSGLRTTGRRKFETLGKAKQVGVIKEGYTLVNNTDMSTIEIAGNNGTIGQLQAEQLLNNYLQSNPEMAEEVAIVRSFEVAA